MAGLLKFININIINSPIYEMVISRLSMLPANPFHAGEAIRRRITDQIKSQEGSFVRLIFSIVLLNAMRLDNEVPNKQLIS